VSDLALPIAYDAWAIEKVATFCATLSPQQLALTTPGTMGTIEATLVHLVAAKERYATYLGAPPAVDPVHETKEQRLAHVIVRARALADWFNDFAKGSIDLERRVERKTPAGTQRLPVAILIAQLIHHGNEHRAQLGSIFGAHGIEAPSYSAWRWGEETGRVSP
jgi:uncharacterized damage-inducible protein DinB